MVALPVCKLFPDVPSFEESQGSQYPDKLGCGLGKRWCGVELRLFGCLAPGTAVGAQLEKPDTQRPGLQQEKLKVEQSPAVLGSAARPPS